MRLKSLTINHCYSQQKQMRSSYQCLQCYFSVCCVIQSGCDVNAQSYSGNTALHSACGRGQIEIVRVLLKNGADSSLKNNHNDTAIMVAKNKKVRTERMAEVHLKSCTVYLLVLLLVQLCIYLQNKVLFSIYQHHIQK